MPYSEKLECFFLETITHPAAAPSQVKAKPSKQKARPVWVRAGLLEPYGERQSGALLSSGLTLDRRVIRRNGYKSDKGEERGGSRSWRDGPPSGEGSSALWAQGGITATQSPSVASPPA